MKRLAVLILAALILSIVPGWTIAAPPVIGTVTATGAFRMNGDTVMSNGTLSEGAVVESVRGDLSVRLSGGARLSLSTGSRGKLYGDRIILERGEARLEKGARFHLEALGLTIRPDRETSTGRIGLLDSKRLRVVALTGSFDVQNAHDALVANVAAGSALAFEPQAADTDVVTRVTGTLRQQNGHFLLTDQVTHVTVEITGQGLQARVGHVIQVTGTLNPAATPVVGASEVIAATSIQAVSAGAGGAAPAGTGGGHAGIGITTIAIIGGVATAATLGGLAASGSLPGQGSTPSVSR
jgi:hypothetical protein